MLLTARQRELEVPPICKSWALTLELSMTCPAVQHQVALLLQNLPFHNHL
jgi:hypothetical protein